MNLITIEQLSKQLGERLLFDGANLLINAGDRIGLIGVNGSGKSTLLRIIAGLEAPDAGRVAVWGGVRVEYLPQEPELDDRLTVLETIFHSESPQMVLLRDYEQASAELQAHPDDADRQARLVALSAELDHTDGWVAENNAKTVLTRLGVTNYGSPVATLSGGQRKRLALARALIDRADLLILDEPTNHIDAETVAWLEEYLIDEQSVATNNSAAGAVLMVTHDRYFLDRVVNRIVELDRRQLVSYPGNYSRYLEQREERHQRLAEAEEKRQNLLRRELEWLRRGAMARSTKQKARKDRVAALMEIRADRGEERVSMTLAGRRLGGQVLTATQLVKRYGDQAVLDGAELHLEPGDRIGIMGPNGAGKSTLLDILAGKQEVDSGSVRWGDTVRLGYYDQRSADLNENQRLIEFIYHEAPLIRTKEGELVEAAQMLEWFLFPRPMHYARISSLSGGERRRLYLLRTLIHQPNVLFLDEPTNDLDIQTLTVLEEFLDHFSGCLLVVSHDRYFLDRTVDFLVALEDGRLGPRYPTPYSSYLRLREEANQPPPPPSKAAAPPPPAPTARAPRLSWKEQRELETLEAQVAALEEKKTKLLATLTAEAGDYLQAQRLSQQLELLESTLEGTLLRWMELAERG
jgi:ABC transport system ATP-binding/permease protein